MTRHFLCALHRSYVVGGLNTKMNGYHLAKKSALLQLKPSEW